MQQELERHRNAVRCAARCRIERARWERSIFPAKQTAIGSFVEWLRCREVPAARISSIEASLVSSDSAHEHLLGLLPAVRCATGPCSHAGLTSSVHGYAEAVHHATIRRRQHEDQKRLVQEHAITTLHALLEWSQKHARRVLSRSQVRELRELARSQDGNLREPLRRIERDVARQFGVMASSPQVVAATACVIGALRDLADIDDDVQDCALPDRRLYAVAEGSCEGDVDDVMRAAALSTIAQALLDEVLLELSAEEIREELLGDPDYRSGLVVIYWAVRHGLLRRWWPDQASLRAAYDAWIEPTEDRRTQPLGSITQESSAPDAAVHVSGDDLIEIEPRLGSP